MVKGYFYVLRCIDRSFYVGSTSDLEIRLAQHEAGEGGSNTSSRLPVYLVYSEEYGSPYDAFLREREVKGWSRLKKEALVRREYDRLPSLSKPKQPDTTP
jgi:putative endonuclease